MSSHIRSLQLTGYVTCGYAGCFVSDTGHSAQWLNGSCDDVDLIVTTPFEETILLTRTPAS
eukprot:6207141-Pleurochrysis_carterae.AAC.5